MLRVRRYASTYAQAQILRKYPVGGIFHGYEVRRVMPVPELRLTAVDLLHKQTGSEHLHIDRDDKNNVFSIAFKTNPPDATGVPHILEHTTLCGSNKYPVRDPFFKMLNRSLSNFMNAMTAHDYTFYPFATTNKSDFENLRDVYIDATLNPLLKAEDFHQEGWRLENSDVNDPKSELIFKGVVYNEMKGQISNASYYFWIKFQEAIYPSLNNSGGDPTKMTNLTYEDLVGFHSKNYHPSNSRTYTYGNLPLQDTLKFLNDKFASHGKRHRVNTKLMPISLHETTNVELEGQIDTMLPEDKQMKTSMTWMCGSPNDYYETFLMSIVGNLLLDSHSSPFYQNLIESGIGTEFSVNTGMDTTTASNFFTVGVQGASDIEKFKEVVQKTLIQAVEDKFDEKRVEAIIEQIELGKKDQKSNFGMQLLYGLVPGWTNVRDPFKYLAVNETLQRFKEDWSSQKNELFTKLIEKYLINKPYFGFTMKGSQDFSRKLEEEEKQRLQAKVKALNEDDLKVIYERNQLLLKNQGAKEDLTCLPSVSVSDIPRIAETFPLKKAANIYNRVTDTNGITYLRAHKNLNKTIPKDLLAFLPLFSDSLTHLGTSTEDYADIEKAIKLYTGGILVHISAVSDSELADSRLLLKFSGWSLNSRTEHITNLWSKLLLNTDFEKNSDKLKVLIKSSVSSSTSSIAESGHSYARGFASSKVSTTKSIDEILNGIEQVKFMNELNKYLDDEKLFQSEVVDKLVRLKEMIINSEDIQYLITTDSAEQVAKVEKELQQFTDTLPKKITEDTNGLLEPNKFPIRLSKPGINSTLIDLPFQVHYTANAKLCVPYTHKDSASLQVLSNILTFKHLHKEIREKGGAYGAGATYNALDGVFSHYSYRDPYPLKSLDIFSQTGDYVLNHAKWDESALNEAKLTIFQGIDAPISRKNEGVIAFNSGITDAMRQERRQQLLDVTMADIRKVAEKHLANHVWTTNTVIGPNIPNETDKPSWEKVQL